MQDLVIILEEEVIPSKDFLFFMAQCLDALKKDESLVGITSFNENGNNLNCKNQLIIIRLS